MLRMTLLTGLPLEYWMSQPLTVIRDFMAYTETYGALDDHVEIGAAMVSANVVAMAGKISPNKMPEVDSFTWRDKLGREPVPEDFGANEAALMSALQKAGVKLEKASDG